VAAVAALVSAAALLARPVGLLARWLLLCRDEPLFLAGLLATLLLAGLLATLLMAALLALLLALLPALLVALLLSVLASSASVLVVV
jgi:hypothetical protein